MYMTSTASPGMEWMFLYMMLVGQPFNIIQQYAQIAMEFMIF